MPTFVADEKTSRSRKAKDATMWQLVDTIESETAFRGGAALRHGFRAHEVFEQPIEAVFLPENKGRAH